jgi:putative transposase
LPIELRRNWVEASHEEISVARQCEVIGLARSSFYYQPAVESAANLQYMRLIDEQYTRMPYYGVEKMTAWLRGKGYEVGPKRVRRLLRLMGLEAIYAKPRLSQSNKQHQIYPYLLRGVAITHKDQVWSTDITYIRMSRGFIYLAAVIDWYTRYVLSWQVSNTLDTSFCLAALDQALAKGQPEIFNTDQGAQFTSIDFTSRLRSADVQISMDGKGRVFDNIFVERLWRTVKQEEVYLNDYQNVPHAIARLDYFFDLYNRERLHKALNYRTPAEVYFGLAV